MGKKLRRETIAAQQNFRGDDTNSVVRPIYPTTAYFFNDAEHGANLFDLSVGGNIYTRLTNPTNDALGQVVSDLEGGVGGLAVASGAAALATVIMVLCKAGDHILASQNLYGGSTALLSNTFSRFGVEVTYVDPEDDCENISKEIKPNTKFILAEVLANPKLDVLNVEKFVSLAKEHDVPLVIDSTFTPPCVFRPIEYGVNIIIHSATKYIGGHGNAMGGIIVDGGNYDWNNGKYPELSEPNGAYHGLTFNEAFGNAAFILHARASVLRDSGSTISPFNAHLLLTGLQTLYVRYKHVSESALRLATWLEANDHIEWVNYPGLKSHKQYDRANKYFEGQAGGVLAFGIKGDKDGCERFINALEVGIHAVNVGDVRTIVTHPASTTHRQLSSEELVKSGISENLIRISIGLESVDDVIEDIEQALQEV